MQNPIGWHHGYSGPWDGTQPPGGVAPSRADLALARHLAKKAAYANDHEAGRSGLLAAIRAVLRRVGSKDQTLNRKLKMSPSWTR